MSLEVRDYVNVQKRAKALGCNVPKGLAFLPRNFDNATAKEDLLQESSTIDIRILFRQAGITETPLEGTSEKYPSISEKSSVWVGPIIFIGAAVLTQNPDLINITLNLISNYLHDFFRGYPKPHKAKLEIVVEKSENKEYLRIMFEGDVSDMRNISAVVREVVQKRD